MNFLAIVALTLAAGVGSVWLAALCMRIGARRSAAALSHRLLGLAAGALLATAFMHLLPEAFESEAAAHELCTLLLVSLVFFFLLSKAELWHHGHEHGPAHARHTHNKHLGTARRGGGWTVLTGDSLHCFGDGVLIASAFLASPRYGLMAAASVLAHEVPHHVGDIVVLRRINANWRAALAKISLAGAATTVGGLAGYLLLGQLHDWLPYFLAVAASSFIYVALADLVPQLQQQLSARETGMQIGCLLLGIAIVTIISQLAHVH